MEFFKDWQILFYFISFNVTAIWTVKKSEPLDQRDRIISVTQKALIQLLRISPGVIYCLHCISHRGVMICSPFLYHIRILLV